MCQKNLTLQKTHRDLLRLKLRDINERIQKEQEFNLGIIQERL